MVSSQAATVRDYLESLPSDRRAIVTSLRRLIKTHLPEGFEEGMQYGMISYYVPFSRLRDTYNRQPLAIVSLASQKNHLSLYLMGLYGDPGRERSLAEAFREAGKRLDMGKSCVRFKRLEDLALPAIAELIAGTSVDEFIAHYRATRAAVPQRGPARARAAAPAKPRGGVTTPRARAKKASAAPQ
jgi:hypothetical protein